MTVMRRLQHLIGGGWTKGRNPAPEAVRTVNRVWDGEKIAEYIDADRAEMEQALQKAKECQVLARKMPTSCRIQLLQRMSALILDRREELALAICDEAGKPIVLSRAEVERAAATFLIAADETVRWSEEEISIESPALPAGPSRATMRRWPRGPVLAITPFNFPLNLVAHKVAPALAIGAPMVLKPPPQTPTASAILGEIFLEAAHEIDSSAQMLPRALLQIVFADPEVVAVAVEDKRIAVLSFTGSDTVGWMLRDRAKQKKVLLELGGNAAVVIDEDANFEKAAAKCAFGAFSYAGQLCISIQRIYVHHNVYKKFQRMLLEEIQRLKVGDPRDEKVLVGPLIDERAFSRLSEWIEEAKQGGAKILYGEGRTDRCLLPTLLTDVPGSCRLMREEAFGPVATLESVDSFETALRRVNDSPFGLQAGIFTQNEAHVQLAAETLEVGGIIVNESPTFRSDRMPYGGMKNSGLGREGVLYAMKEMSETTVLVRASEISA